MQAPAQGSRRPQAGGSGPRAAVTGPAAPGPEPHMPARIPRCGRRGRRGRPGRRGRGGGTRRGVGTCIYHPCLGPGCRPSLAGRRPASRAAAAARLGDARRAPPSLSLSPSLSLPPSLSLYLSISPSLSLSRRQARVSLPGSSSSFHSLPPSRPPSLPATETVKKGWVARRPGSQRVARRGHGVSSGGGHGDCINPRVNRTRPNWPGQSASRVSTPSLAGLQVCPDR